MKPKQLYRTQWVERIASYDNFWNLFEDVCVSFQKYYSVVLTENILFNCSLRYGRMVKALACRVEGPGFESHHGKKVSVKKFWKKKKRPAYPLLA